MSRALTAAQYFAHIARALSPERLRPYRPPGGDDLDLIANYLWNIALSEALYPALQNLEVTLRNAMHNAATRAFGTDMWFDQPTVLALESRESAMVQRAKQDLRDHQFRRHGAGHTFVPLTAGQMVAQLMFGFWTSLLNAPYEQRLWAPPAPGGGIFNDVFPHVPRRLRSRRRMIQHLQPIRQLRNRVFHYEHIWDWVQPGVADLGDQHAQLLETIEWIDPTIATTVRSIDRFPTVYSQGRAFYRAFLPY